MVPWVASGQLAAVLADGAEFQAGWMLRAALRQQNGGVAGPCWAAWPCSQMMLLLPDVFQAKVLTGGGDLREAQVDVPLSVSHSCV